METNGQECVVYGLGWDTDYERGISNYIGERGMSQEDVYG